MPHTHRGLCFLRYLKANHNIPLKQSKPEMELPKIFATSSKEDCPLLWSWRWLSPVEIEYSKERNTTTSERSNFFYLKKTSTYTFAQIASFCGDICSITFLSVPFLCWIRACARTCPVSPSARHTAWLPWWPLAPTAIHWDQKNNPWHKSLKKWV